MKILKHISRKLVKKALDLIKTMAEEEQGEEVESSEDDDDNNNETSTTKEEKSHEEENPDESTEEQKKEAEEKKNRYRTFWKEFGKSIKLGIIEDSSNREKLAKLSRYESNIY